MFFKLSNIYINTQSYNNTTLDQKLDIFIIIYQNNILIYITNAGKVILRT